MSEGANVCYGPLHPNGQLFATGIVKGGRCPGCRSAIARHAHQAAVRKHGYGPSRKSIITRAKTPR